MGPLSHESWLRKHGQQKRRKVGLDADAAKIGRIPFTSHVQRLPLFRYRKRVVLALARNGLISLDGPNERADPITTNMIAITVSAFKDACGCVRNGTPIVERRMTPGLISRWGQVGSEGATYQA